MQEVIWGLTVNVLPLFGVVVLGFLIGSKLGSLPDYISKALIYLLIPLLVIDSVTKAKTEQLAIIPPMIFLLAAAMTAVAFLAKKKLGSELDKRLLSSSFSFFNIAFFGVPIVTAIFSPDKVSTVICAYIGSAVYGDTIGYFMIARTQMKKWAAFMQVIKTPLLYAFAAAIILNLVGFETPEALKPVAGMLGWLVSGLGMFVIGCALSDTRLKEIAYVQLTKLVAMRQISAVLILGVLIFAEAMTFNILEAEDRVIVALIAIFPIAATVTVFATMLDTQQKETAALVAFSNVVSLVLASIAGIMLAAFGVGGG